MKFREALGAKVSRLRKRLGLIPQTVTSLAGANWDVAPIWEQWPNTVTSVTGTPASRLPNRGYAKLLQASYLAGGWYGTLEVVSPATQLLNAAGCIGVALERVPQFAYGGSINGTVIEQFVSPGNNTGVTLDFAADVLQARWQDGAGGLDVPDGWEDLDTGSHEGDIWIGCWRAGGLIYVWARAGELLSEGTISPQTNPERSIRVCNNEALNSGLTGVHFVDFTGLTP